jgi:ribosomal protein S6
MSETNMPAVEVGSHEHDVASYELAFHILPTIAEGEVQATFEKIKATITNLGGVIIGEEAPARFDLAFEIDKYLEGRNRKFKSAYFAWVRFTIAPSKLAEVKEMAEGQKELLRHLLIRLNKAEEANPFMFHPSVSSRTVETIIIADEEEVVDEVVEVVEDVIVDGEEKVDAV